MVPPLRSLSHITALIWMTGALAALAAADGSATVERPRGVAKSKAALYIPQNGQFKCLDGSQSIPFERVNDDYCDCNDGSDEPGTSACPNGVFHCANRWHRPANIPSSRVNDGICDPACCDGSDEFNGVVVCQDRCKEIGEKERETRRKLREIQREGGRKRAEYAQIGQAAKQERAKRLGLLQREEKELGGKITELQAAKERVEEAERAEADTPQARRIGAYKSRLETLEYKLETARDRVSMLRGDIAMLLDAFKDMKENHNQNYHDMAVKHAIEAYDELEKQRSTRYEPESDDDLVPPPFSNDIPIQDTHGDGDGDDASALHSKATDNWWDWLQAMLGLRTQSADEILKSVQGGRYIDADALRDALQQMQTRQLDVERDIRTAESKADIDFGPDHSFAALEDKCFELKHTDGNTYEFCMFGDIKQKQSEYHSIQLGRFQGWNTDVDANAASKYLVQHYDQGEHCWNGPQRSVKVTLECGTENKLIAVNEPETCVYTMRVQTPAACPILDEKESSTSADEQVQDTASESVKDEL